MKGIAKEFLEFLDVIDSFVKKTAIGLTAMIALTVTLQVLFRYILKNPLVWTEELSRYLLVWMAFIGASSLIKREGNVGVEFFQEKLPVKAAKIIKFIIKVIILIFIIIVLTQSIIIFPKVSSNQVTPAMQISMLYPQFGVILGFFLMLLQMIGLIVKEFVERGTDND